MGSRNKANGRQFGYDASQLRDGAGLGLSSAQEVGHIKTENLIEVIPGKKEADEKLKEQEKKAQMEIQKLQQDFQTWAQQTQASFPSLSEEDKAKAEQQFQEKQQRIAQYQQEASKNLIISEPFKDCFLLENTVFGDDRGYFMESFNKKRFHELTGLQVEFVQDNQSKSVRNVIRGLHIQRPPFCQAKLVRVLQGQVLDVAVDVREGSPTYGQSFVAELSAENNRLLFVPKGMLHGFSVLSEAAVFSYKCDDYYNKEAEDGVYPLDSDLKIDWGVNLQEAILSDKDKDAQIFADFKPILLVIGSGGQLGSCIQQKLKLNPLKGYQLSFVDYPELDLSKASLIESYFFSNQFDYIINCAAYTQVDKAEEEVEQAFVINADAAGLLAEEAKEQNAVLIHISTDYVFDGKGKRPYKEEDATAPINVYGKSKLQGEQKALALNPKTYVIRTSWLYSAYGQNFFKSMLRLFDIKEELGIVSDQKGCPTSAHDLADVILKIIQRDTHKFGVYHFSNSEETSWYGFATKIAQLSQASINIKPIDTKDYPTPAERPKFSVMDCSKIEAFLGMKIRSWDSALEEVWNLYRKMDVGTK
ncbi:unnamed protein product [Cyprideis torosa]|uniref:Methionine adenosyltransferase 2 subunit beta n=1 Tax=Cyprideis torosa TaxID=163714 RepID=A0A7R8WNE3_9CRUS|nr:unnamed protein product [Cyprideis torosa]CAG0906234.1 unnamed protein product [Cyprideis torosa]